MTHAWVNKYASMWCSEMMFITLLCEFSPFINTLLCETSKTDRIWTLRCGKRKNILAKQINSALSPWGSSLRKSDAETEPAWSSGQHQPPLALSIRWSLEVIHYRLMGNVITTETRKIGYAQLLYEAPHWQAHTEQTDLKSTEPRYYTTLFVSSMLLAGWVLWDDC